MVYWLPSKKTDTVVSVQILDVAICIFQYANTLRKGINSIILFPAVGK